jgi:hypothetical protein
MIQNQAGLDHDDPALLRVAQNRFGLTGWLRPNGDEPT